jgi:transcriptional regulator with XRE-family HTH domain
VATPLIRRLVGTTLRRYRDNLGLSLEDTASMLECDRSKISRIESGIRGIRPRELRELLTEYGVCDTDQQILLRLISRKDRPAWLSEYARVLPGEVAEYYGLEPAAAEIMIYDARAVPSLLQTPAYARIIAGTGLGSPADDYAGWIAAACEQRQELILDGTRRVSVVMGEAAIRQQVGAPPVTAGQLDRLAGLAADPGVTVQILPFTAGAHAASGSTSFSVLRFGGDLTVVFVPTVGAGGVFVDDPRAVAIYLRAFVRLRAEALTVQDSVQLVQAAAGPPWD